MRITMMISKCVSPEDGEEERIYSISCIRNIEMSDNNFKLF